MMQRDTRMLRQLQNVEWRFVKANIKTARSAAEINGMKIQSPDVSDTQLMRIVDTRRIY
jgi:hypothetical protein